MSTSKTRTLDHPSNWISIKMGRGERTKGFVTIKWKASSTNSEITRKESFWHVRSTFAEEALLNFLRLKYFWNELTDQETILAFDNPRFLKSIEFNVLLTVLASTEYSRTEISEASNKVSRILGRKSKFSKSLLPQWENNIFLVAERTERPIRPSKKYSGWVRNSSSVGSKRQAKFFIPEPLFEEFPEEHFDEYELFCELIFADLSGAKNGTITIKR